MKVTILNWTGQNVENERPKKNSENCHALTEPGSLVTIVTTNRAWQFRKNQSDDQFSFFFKHCLKQISTTVTTNLRGAQHLSSSSCRSWCRAAVVLRRRRRLRYPVLTTTALASLSRSHSQHQQWLADPFALASCREEWRSSMGRYRLQDAVPHLSRRCSNACLTCHHPVRAHVGQQCSGSLHSAAVLPFAIASRGMPHENTWSHTATRRTGSAEGWVGVDKHGPTHPSIHCVLGWVQQLPSSRLGKYLCLYIISVLLCFIKI
jgi:hypothetical protein